MSFNFVPPLTVKTGLAYCAWTSLSATFRGSLRDPSAKLQWAWAVESSWWMSFPDFFALLLFFCFVISCYSWTSHVRNISKLLVNWEKDGFLKIPFVSHIRKVCPLCERLWYWLQAVCFTIMVVMFKPREKLQSVLGFQVTRYKFAYISVI